MSLNRDPQRTVTIPILAEGRDGATRADFAADASVTFRAGETRRNISFTAAPDDVNDPGEAVQLSFDLLPGGVAAGGRNRTLVNIVDTDTPHVYVQFSPGDYSVREGGSVTVTLELNEAPERRVVVPLVVDDDGVESDYSGIPGERRVLRPTRPVHLSLSAPPRTGNRRARSTCSSRSAAPRRT